MKSLLRYLLVFGLMAGLAQAAVGDKSPLSRAELTKVEAMLAKNLKGKPAIKSGEKEEIEGGWKISCVADVGTGGEFTLILTAEKSMTLGTVIAQNPNEKPAPRKA